MTQADFNRWQIEQKNARRSSPTYIPTQLINQSLYITRDLNSLLISREHHVLSIPKIQALKHVLEVNLVSTELRWSCVINFRLRVVRADLSVSFFDQDKFWPKFVKPIYAVAGTLYPPIPLIQRCQGISVSSPLTRLEWLFDDDLAEVLAQRPIDKPYSMVATT